MSPHVAGRLLACVLAAAAAAGCCHFYDCGPRGPVCPFPDSRKVEPNSSFTIELRNAAGALQVGTLVKVVRTQRVPKEQCPALIKDEASGQTFIEGRVEFKNMLRGTYLVEGEGLPEGTKIDFGAKATATTFAIAADGSVTSDPPLPELVTARFVGTTHAAKADLPEAGRASFTITDSATLIAFQAWHRSPDRTLTVDFGRERLAALYRQLPAPSCESKVVFGRGAQGVGWRVETLEMSSRLTRPLGVCSPKPAPTDPYWALAVLPADPTPVVGTTALAATAAWLPTPAPSVAPSVAPTARPSTAPPVPQPTSAPTASPSAFPPASPAAAAAE